MLAFRSAPWLVVSSLALSACPSQVDTNGPPQDPSATEVSTTFGTFGTGSTGSESGTGSGSSETSPADTSSSSGPEGPSNCGELRCSGHSSCELDNDNVPYCACDEGYIHTPDGVTCEIDQGCIQVRYLEDFCRQLANSVPAVGIFFAVDFCAGPAVTPDLIEDLGLEFKVLENGIDIEKNVESYSRIIDKQVESYVTVALDVSDSVTESEDLPALIDEVRTFVGALSPSAGEPDVYVSIYVFGRGVGEYVPFTRDFAAVDDALAAIAVDPAPVVLLAGNGNGTDLYRAVEVGINRTQRIRDLRDAVTWGGVLSTGTVVVVTDGNDTSNGDLDTTLIDSTVNNVISIGISDDIDNEDLQRIGRDASILAPTPDDWAAAFAEIATRVDQYPERSYLLAYCSSATEGTPNVEVTVAGIGTHHVTGASCNFNADAFSSSPLAICDGPWFDAECETKGCGGLTACGSCADTECCAFDVCSAPMSVMQAGVDCSDQPELCAPPDSVCDTTMEPDVPAHCAPPAPPMGMGCDPGCEPGVTWCSEVMDGVFQCVDVLAPGETCDDPAQCPSLNCSRINPENVFSDRVCRDGAQLHDYCGGDEADCEMGGYCVGSECQPKLKPLQTCSSDNNCRTGTCANMGTAGNRCTVDAVCFWAWDEKVPD